MLRVYLVLLATAQKWYEKVGKKPDPTNPADPYMTLLGYFNKHGKGRVAQGDCSPRAPTDPDLRISRIRLVVL